MLKYYDVKCTKCNCIEEQLVESGEKFEPCRNCGGEVKRAYTSFNFKLLYDPKKDRVGWSFNDYGESHYWDEVKAEREKGKDVKPINEK